MELSLFPTWILFLLWKNSLLSCAMAQKSKLLPTLARLHLSQSLAHPLLLPPLPYLLLLSLFLVFLLLQLLFYFLFSKGRRSIAFLLRAYLVSRSASFFIHTIVANVSYHKAFILTQFIQFIIPVFVCLLDPFTAVSRLGSGMV